MVFFGTDARTGVGMSTNPAGFGESPDLRMDFFQPGSPEERWSVGYMLGGDPYTGSNSLLEGPTDITDNTVTDESTASLAKARSVGTLNDTLQVTQVVSFKRADKFFKNEVTLKNVGAEAIDSVRYLRSFDPDNTVDQGGEYDTQNQVLFTHAAGDGKAVVLADTSWNDDDPVFVANGSRSPIFFYSTDPRAVPSTYGFSNSDPYDPAAYDDPAPKGTSQMADEAITLAFDVGTLAPGQEETFVYYTVLDNGDFETVLETVEEETSGPADDGDNVTPEVEDAGPNGGDVNGDGTPDSEQQNVSSLPNPNAGNVYQALETNGTCNSITNIDIKAESAYGSDSTYNYPLGLTNFTLSCTAPGGTANVRILFDKVYDTSNWKARKFINGAFKDVSGVTFGTAIVGSTQVTTMSYSLTDGGPYDADGTANGVIVDPVGPAVLGTSTTLAPSTGLAARSMLSVYTTILLGTALLYVGTRRTKTVAVKK